jgi:hypothetical protein
MKPADAAPETLPNSEWLVPCSCNSTRHNYQAHLWKRIDHRRRWPKRRLSYHNFHWRNITMCRKREDFPQTTNIATGREEENNHNSDDMKSAENNIHWSNDGRYRDRYGQWSRQRRSAGEISYSLSQSPDDEAIVHHDMCASIFDRRRRRLVARSRTTNKKVTESCLASNPSSTVTA